MNEKDGRWIRQVLGGELGAGTDGPFSLYGRYGIVKPGRADRVGAVRSGRLRRGKKRASGNPSAGIPFFPYCFTTLGHLLRLRWTLLEWEGSRGM